MVMLWLVAMQHKVVRRCQEETEINLLKPQLSKDFLFLLFTFLEL